MPYKEAEKQASEMRTKTIETTTTHAEGTATHAPLLDTMQPVGQVLGEQHRHALPVPTMDPLEAEALRSVAPPDYVPMTEEEKKQCGKKRKQRKAEAAKRAAYEEKHKDKIRNYNRLKGQIERRIEGERAMSQEERATLEATREAQIETEARALHAEGYHVKVKRLVDTVPPVVAEPEAMMEALELGTTMESTFREISELDQAHWRDKEFYTGAQRAEMIHGEIAAESYMRSTPVADGMNQYMRDKSARSPHRQTAEDLKKGMKHTRLPMDRVVRRGYNKERFAKMLGLTNGTVALENLQRAMAEGAETTLVEKGFCSTSTKPNCGYFCDVELIILAHKGAKGVDYAHNHLHDHESELLLDAGTKFRPIRMEPVERPLSDGTTQQMTRIYLETIGDENQAPEVDEVEQYKTQARRKVLGVDKASVDQ